MNQTYTMTLATGTTWSTDTDAYVQMVVCYPYMNTAGTEVTECEFIMVYNLSSTSVPNYGYGRVPSVPKQPTFDNITSLDDQLEREGDWDCNLDYNGTTETYRGAMACESPATILNLANSKFTTSSFSFQVSITQPFTTEESQSTY